jgi:hypothetical protein
VTIEEVVIRNNNGTLLEISADTCTPEPLAPNVTCVVVAGAQTAWGRFEISGGASKVRGQCLLSTAGSVVLESTELR